MDLKTTEKKIREVEAAIHKDLTEVEKTDGLIKRNQEKKKMLEARVKENRNLLADLQNRKTVLTIESKIGTMDEGKLALLEKFLGAHGEAFERGGSDRKEETDEGEEDHPAPVGK